MGAVIDSLINAILASQTKQAAALVEQGAPVNGLSRYGSTPLYMAAVQGEAEIAHLLLEAGADPNKESAGESEGTPLCAAASWGHAEVVRLLLLYGADPNLIERTEEAPMTALTWARRNHHDETIRLLLDSGAST
jgi:ankyrin repeat protein